MKTAEPLLLIIAGPTAVGKSHMALEIAKHFNTCIVSADSRQCYQELTIGTAKPSAEELSAVDHYFINHLSIQNEYSVGDFEREFIPKLDELFQKHPIVILCGGTGLYIDAIRFGLDTFPDVDQKHIDYYQDLLEQVGIESLQNELKNKDPEYAHRADLENPHRLIRALSVIKESGKAFSSFLNQEKKKRNFSVLSILLEMDREKLYQRINLRVDQMMEEGLLIEAEKLKEHKSRKSLQTVGYQELFSHFDGDCTLAEAIELIKRNSRRYAKRQMTWFRRDPNWKRFMHDDEAGILEEVNRHL